MIISWIFHFFHTSLVIIQCGSSLILCVRFYPGNLPAFLKFICCSVITWIFIYFLLKTASLLRQGAHKIGCGSAHDFSLFFDSLDHVHCLRVLCGGTLPLVYCSTSIYTSDVSLSYLSSTNCFLSFVICYLCYGDIDGSVTQFVNKTLCSQDYGSRRTDQNTRIPSASSAFLLFAIKY